MKKKFSFGHSKTFYHPIRFSTNLYVAGILLTFLTVRDHFRFVDFHDFSGYNILYLNTELYTLCNVLCTWISILSSDLSSELLVSRFCTRVLRKFQPIILDFNCYVVLWLVKRFVKDTNFRRTGLRNCKTRTSRL